MTNHINFSRSIDNCLEAKVILRSGTICYASQGFIDLLDFKSHKDILGENIFNYMHPSCLEEEFVRLLKGRHAEIFPIHNQEMICADGRIIETEIMAAPFIHQSEILVQVLIRDLSDIKKHEELLRQSEKLSLIGEFASGMVHEIRNPLTAMKGFLQLMKSHPKPEYIDIVLQELKEIEDIANELLHFSKPAEHPLTRQNLTDIVVEVINFCGAEAFKQNIQVELFHEQNLEIEVIGSKTQLKQVLLNIIKNGIEAIMTNGKIKVHITQNDDNVGIHIIDNGVGIPKDQLNNIGKSFFTSKKQGTGLGMMVSFNIIQNHNGSINIESEEGKGTAFIITLPLAEKKSLSLSP
ncbi:ATP-binding protein [Bacillus sp. SCS-153A]|uniref:ATP-binding protein n=1 Tax=Rossellomorea sedimentorum TaxID=3115294 RepID=UPI003906C5FA